MSAVLKPARQPRRVRYTEVEHEIDEWADEDLIAELERRNIQPPEGSVSINDLFNAMQFRNHDRAIELLREYLMNVTGRILP